MTGDLLSKLKFYAWRQCQRGDVKFQYVLDSAHQKICDLSFKVQLLAEKIESKAESRPHQIFVPFSNVSYVDNLRTIAQQVSISAAEIRGLEIAALICDNHVEYCKSMGNINAMEVAEAMAIDIREAKHRG